jgi:hypothetical protein
LGGGPDQHHFVVAAAVAGGRSVFKEPTFAVSELLVKGHFRPRAVMAFRYRKALAREFFFLRGAAIRGKKDFR